MTLRSARLSRQTTASDAAATKKVTEGASAESMKKEGEERKVEEKAAEPEADRSVQQAGNIF